MIKEITMFAHFLRAVWLLLLLGELINARCPNDCSRHGKCNIYNICECDAGYDHAPDCSQLSCPYDLAWASKSQSLNSAHTSMECSNNGICNRETVSNCC